MDELLAACKAALLFLKSSDFDFRNGITAFGVDEGQALGERDVRRLRQQLERAIAIAENAEWHEEDNGGGNDNMPF